MAFKDYPDTPAGRKERRAFYESEDGLALIEGWRRQGINVAQIAIDYIGISQQSFQKWRKESDAIRKAMDVAIEICNSNVEKSLYQKAIGYYYYEEIEELIEGEMRLTRRCKRYMPPDTKAILAWLYNKMPNQYRCIQEPLEETQYVDTIKNILIGMRDVANTGEERIVDVESIPSE